MTVTSVKLLAAAAMVTCGVGLTAGSGWLATADAQDAARAAPARVDATEEVRRLQAQLDLARAAAELQTKRAHDAEAEARAQRDAATAREQEVQRFLLTDLVAEAKADKDTATFKTAKNEYNLIVVSDITQTKFRELLERYEARGWEYCGTTPLADPKQLVWVFRRPLKAVAATSPAGSPADDLYRGTVERYLDAGRAAVTTPRPSTTPPAGAATSAADRAPTTTAIVPRPATASSPGAVGGDVRTANTAPQADDAKAVESEIMRLQMKLAQMQTKPGRVVFGRAGLPLEPVELHGLLTKLADKKFGPGKCSVSYSEHGVAVEGDRGVTDWAAGVVKSIGGK